MNNKYISSLENSLYSYIDDNDKLYKVLIDSMMYSLKAGGKRIRPVLTLAFCDAISRDYSKALPFACGVEMIHTYSLIHDDLPCMDDDDIRRGKPSNHKTFGEDIALLAGDGLLTLAFETMSGKIAVNSVGAEKALKCVNVLSDYAGIDGMVGGQVIDLISEDKSVPLSTVTQMHMLKTSALIKAACAMGAICGGANDEEIKNAEKFGEYLGLAFQIEDDILDVTSSTEELGKPVGSDESNNKSTYVSLLGIDKCRELVTEYTKNAIDCIDKINADTKELKEIALSLTDRKN